jgi:hypothetical protein
MSLPREHAETTASARGRESLRCRVGLRPGSCNSRLTEDAGSKEPGIQHPKPTDRSSGEHPRFSDGT